MLETHEIGNFKFLKGKKNEAKVLHVKDSCKEVDTRPCAIIQLPNYISEIPQKTAQDFH